VAPPSSGPPSSGGSSSGGPPAGGQGPSGSGAAPTNPAGSGGATTAGRGAEVKPIENPAAGVDARRGTANAGAVAIMAALGVIGQWLQERAARDAWDETKDSVVQTLTDQPWLGVLVVYRYTQGPAPITMSAPRIFRGIDTFYGETRADAASGERAAGVLLPAGPEDTISAERKWIEPAAPGTKPKPPPAPAPAAAGPKSAAELDKEIDQAIARNDWTLTALTVNGFSIDDINKRVTGDARLTGKRKELMKGALAGMILWAPPNRVADAIAAADPGAARLGRIEYVNDVVDTGGGGAPARSFGNETWKKAALALNGLNDNDLGSSLPRALDKLKLIRDEAIKAGLVRVKQQIEAAKPGQDWSLP
jgi:hypothetical protein